MNISGFTKEEPTEEGYYIHIARYSPRVEVQHLILKEESDGYGGSNIRLYNVNADKDWDWGPDPGYMYNSPGIWKKINVPSNPKLLIEKFYDERR